MVECGKRFLTSGESHCRCLMSHGDAVYRESCEWKLGPWAVGPCNSHCAAMGAMEGDRSARIDAPLRASLSYL